MTCTCVFVVVFNKKSINDNGVCVSVCVHLSMRYPSLVSMITPRVNDRLISYAVCRFRIVQEPVVFKEVKSHLRPAKVLSVT